MIEIAGVSPADDAKRRTFFGLVFGPEARGLLCIAFIDRYDRRIFSEQFFQYPDDIDSVLSSIKSQLGDKDVYFCPQLFRERRRTKENVESTPVLWADLDYCEPERMLVKPTVTVQSSPGRYQAYWHMGETVDPDDAENLSQRIAYYHKEQGCDQSGWDLTQLLRVAHTYNYKYDEAYVVRTIEARQSELPMVADFDQYPEAEPYHKVQYEFPGFETIQAINVEQIMQSVRMTMNPLVWGLFGETPEDNKWSEVLWKLLIMLFESGFTREQVYAIATEAACNKYARDGRPAIQLWKDVCRAEAKFEIENDTHPTGDFRKVELLTEQERATVNSLKPTFVERYIEWAAKQTDAPREYHQAGALIALSTMLCGSVRLPTSFGTIVPNIWFMILAQTTITRKSTAMDLAMDLIAELDEDAILATDGSVEGLLTSLSARPGKPGIFLRDEFSGLLESMSKKDYMSGMAELLTKLYDAKMQKRVLKSNVVEVKEPRLIIFAGGIKDAITSLLSQEQVASGFIPRFIFISAESKTSRIRPIGPPTTVSLEERNKILAELEIIKDHYNKNETVYVQTLTNGIVSVDRKTVFDATMTDDAWLRYNTLEAKMINMGLESNTPDTMTPMFDRLCKSMLKVAILMAASRQLNPDNTVVVEEIDILRAARYGEEWVRHAQLIIKNVGKGGNEYLLERIMKKIVRDGANGSTRSQLMQNFRLDSRQASTIFDTLEQRGLVTKNKRGRGEIYTATPHVLAKVGSEI